MIKMRLRDFVERNMNLGRPEEGLPPEYVEHTHLHPNQFTNDYFGKPVLLIVDEPINFDRFLHTDDGKRFTKQMLPWFERWVEADRVSHIVMGYGERWKEVGFRVWFKDETSMNGGIVMDREGNWSSHT